MSKNTEIKLVGQPILSQVLQLVDKNDFDRLFKKEKSDHFYKAFKSWAHFVTMMFGIMSRCDSMTEICEGLRGMSGKLRGCKRHLPRVPQGMVYVIAVMNFLSHYIMI